jgi:hypothetical protein
MKAFGKRAGYLMEFIIQKQKDAIKYKTLVNGMVFIPQEVILDETGYMLNAAHACVFNFSNPNKNSGYVNAIDVIRVGDEGILVKVDEKLFLDKLVPNLIQSNIKRMEMQKEQNTKNNEVSK